MKIGLVVVLVIALISAVGVIWKYGGKYTQNKIELDRANATIEQLETDAKDVEVLEQQNVALQERIDHAENVYKSIKDPSGCFRKPIPRPAAVELWDLYERITGKARSSPVQ